MELTGCFRRCSVSYPSVMEYRLANCSRRGTSPFTKGKLAILKSKSSSLLLILEETKQSEIDVNPKRGSRYLKY